MKRPILYPILRCMLFIFLFSFKLYGQKKSPTFDKVIQGIDQIDVYICGSWYDPNTFQAYAAYWKNGKQVVIKDGQAATNFSAVSCAHSIAVNGSDIHVVGERLNSQNNFVPAYWKNQRLQPLQLSPAPNGNPGSSSIGGVEVVNGSVYLFPNLSGWIEEYYYLSNGQKTTFPNKMPNGETNSRTHFVNGNDIYLVGNKSVANYFKNGKEIILDNTMQYPDRVRSTGIFVVGNDVYVSGEKSYVARSNSPNKSMALYWKNGQEVILSTGVGPNSGQFANSVCANGNDVYVAGSRMDPKTGESLAVYWKNGQEVILGKGPTFTKAQYISVAGNDVYVAGIVANKNVYWKNGKEVELPGCSLLYYMILAKGNGSAQESTNLTDNNAQNITPTADPSVEAKVFLVQNKKKPGIVAMPSGLQYEVLRQGTGAKPLPSDKVTIINKRDVMVGKDVIETGTPSSPITKLVKELIPGLSEGVQIMNVGSKYRFYIPAKLSHGETRPLGGIFIFETELLEIQKL